MLSKASKTMSGIIVITIPTILYGGYFLLQLLSGQYSEFVLTEFQTNMFRAGHGHAGVIILLSLICQILVDHTQLGSKWQWLVRIGIPSAALFISGGFFAAAAGDNVTSPNSFIWILYTGVGILAISIIILGIGLLKKENNE